MVAQMFAFCRVFCIFVLWVAGVVSFCRGDYGDYETS